MNFSDRLDYLKKVSTDKKVLHVGCCGLIKKLKDPNEKRSHIHVLIESVANELYGLDIDIEELHEMRQMGHSNLYYADIQNGYPPELKNQKFDVVFFGNMFNYLTNPIKLLSDTKDFLKPGGKVVITVNNSLSVKSFIRLILNKNDPAFHHHVFNYSPKTSQELLKKANARNVKLSYCWHGPDIFYKQTKKSKFLTFLLKNFIRNNNLSDTIILEFQL